MDARSCPHCDSQHTRRFGTRSDGRQRWQCCDCRKTFSTNRVAHPVTGKLDPRQAVLALNCLLEGNSVASTERLTGITKKSLLRLLNRAAERCRQVWEEKMTDLSLENLQADELWGFVAKKQKRVTDEDPAEYGDAYTFVAIDAETKLIPSFAVGKRDSGTTLEFVTDLESRLNGVRPQLTTDGFGAYLEAVETAFGADVDYAQLIKMYGATVEPGRERYSPSGFVAATKTIVSGNPDKSLICTSHVERQNLTCRMSIRRLTRLTNAFSKCLKNLKAAVMLHMAAYNFVRIHQTIRVTPAMEAKITDHVWSLEELLGVS